MTERSKELLWLLLWCAVLIGWLAVFLKTMFAVVGMAEQGATSVGMLAGAFWGLVCARICGAIRECYRWLVYGRRANR